MKKILVDNRSFGKACYIGFGLIALLFASSLRAQVWHSIAPMHFARTALAAVTFPDGRILVAGGNDGTESLSSCEIYDPKTNIWTLTGSMNEPRFSFPMITLPDGRIMVAGGLTDVGIATTAGIEIYDTQTGVWTQMSPMSTPREDFPLLLLPNGKVFVNGGANANTDTYLVSTELFDPIANTSQLLASMDTPTFGQAILYDSLDNHVIIQGGSNNQVAGRDLLTTQIFNATANSWSLGPNSFVPLDLSTFIDTPDHGLLGIGGRSSYYVASDVIEVLRAPYKQWDTLGHLTSPRWYGSVVMTSGDSILYIGGNNNPGVNTDVYDSTNWFNYSTHQTTQGPRLLVPRSSFGAVVSKVPIAPCIDSVEVVVFGGTSTGQVVNTCEALSLGIQYEPGYAPATLALATTMQSVTNWSCGALDTSVELGVAGCGTATTSLDSLWLTGSPSFIISDHRSSPRTLSANDSVLVSYAGMQGPDTAILHIQYNLGSGDRDTTIQLIGTVPSEVTAHSAQLHREAASSYFGQLDSLPLAVDLNSQINIDSLWPYITDISFTYSWDSSVVGYASYVAPAGWLLSSISQNGNTANIEIRNHSSSATQPLDLGTALFLPDSTLLATGRVDLPSLLIDVGGQALPLCVTDNEDNHWAVKTLGPLDIVSNPTPLTQDEEGLEVYPNPAGDELFVQNTNDLPVSITMFDAVGRMVSSASAASNSTVSLNIESLPNGSYVLICHVGDQIVARRVNKLQ